MESYTNDIRHVSGHLNVLTTILKNDKSADLGIILYDKALNNWNKFLSKLWNFFQ